MVKKFDEFIRNLCQRMHLDRWKSPFHLPAGRHPCLRQQEDTGLARGDLTVSCGGVGGGGLASQLV
jgi:hypothetical protein